MHGDQINTFLILAIGNISSLFIQDLPDKY